MKDSVRERSERNYIKINGRNLFDFSFREIPTFHILGGERNVSGRAQNESGKIIRGIEIS